MALKICFEKYNVLIRYETKDIDVPVILAFRKTYQVPAKVPSSLKIMNFQYQCEKCQWNKHTGMLSKKIT